MYTLMIEGRPRGHSIVVGRYEDAEHARRDCYLRRIAHPRAFAVSVRDVNGHALVKLFRRAG